MIYPADLKLQDMTTTEIENKIKQLNSMYFVTGNIDVQQQIILLLDTYKIELEERARREAKKRSENDNNDLDSLINVS